MTPDALLPFIFLITGAILSYAMGRTDHVAQKKHGAAYTAVVFVVLSLCIQLFLAVQIWQTSSPLTYVIGGTTLRMDSLAVLISLVALLLGAVVCLFSAVYMEHDKGQEYFYTLLLLMIAGIIGIGLATDFLILYLFFELMSIPSFALVTFRRHEWMAIEAGMKYIIMSAVGSALAFFGISLLYLQTGSLQFQAIMSRMSTLGNTPILQTSLILLVIGFGVKAAMVPLHTWLPDAHSAAPSGISAMLSGIVIGAGFFTMLRSIVVFTGVDIPIGEALIVMALLTITVGNLMAFVQLSHKKADLKRILAYSSVAQMGYIILGISVGLAYGIRTGFEGGLFHIMTHAFMKGLAFLCAGAFIHQLGSRYVDDMQGAGFSMKFTGFAFTISLLALAGVPPLCGFMSEWLVFSGAIMTFTHIGFWGILIAVIALGNALLSLGYYLPLIRTLYMKPEKKFVQRATDPAPTMTIAIGILTVFVIVLGIWPELGLQAVKPAVNTLISLVGVML